MFYKTRRNRGAGSRRQRRKRGRRCWRLRSEEHTSELQPQSNLVCRLLLEKKNINNGRCLTYQNPLTPYSHPHPSTTSCFPPLTSPHAPNTFMTTTASTHSPAVTS